MIDYWNIKNALICWFALKLFNQQKRIETREEKWKKKKPK